MKVLTSQIKYLNLLYFQSANLRHLSNVAQLKPKNSYVFMTGSTKLTSATVGDVLEEAVLKAGDKTAFISAQQGISKSYNEFKKEVDKLASGFIASGLQKGEKIALFSPNCYEWPLTQFAAAKAGLILVNINPASQPNEVEYCLKKVGCKAVIAFDKFKMQDGYELFSQMLPNLSTSDPRKLRSEKLPNLESVILLGDEDKKGTISFQEVMNSGNKDSQEILSKVEKSIEFDEPVNIQFTSGTTGLPKAAILSHHSIVNNALISGKVLGYNKVEPLISLCQAPMFHTMGSVLVTLAMVSFQGACVFPSQTYDPVAHLQNIEKHKCTVICGTPTMYVDLINTNKQLHADISSIKRIMVGGAAPSESLLKEIIKAFNSPVVQVAYGLTETSPCVLTGTEDSDYETIVKGYMTPIEYMEIQIVDQNGVTVPTNATGEICCRGHAVFLGYSDKEETDKVIDKSRWFHTGDLATMNEKGESKIVGRIKDMVVRGGENIYCLEVENFISSHPAVLETSIVGVPDERLGEELCCWISVKPGLSLTEEEIKTFCKGKISHYKIPRYIMFVKEFPKTLSGKIKKFEIAGISKEKLNW